MAAVQTQNATLHIEVVGEKEMDFLPGAALEGAPAIENKGTIDAYCFMTVETPSFPAETVALEKNEPISDPVPLIRYTVSDAWKLVEKNEADGIIIEVYAYGSPERLHPGETTNSLFTEWRVTNFRVRDGMCGDTAYGDLTAQAERFRIQGYAIQADHIGDNPTPETLWQMIN
jgi:hypothetical protein